MRRILCTAVLASLAAVPAWGQRLSTLQLTDTLGSFEFHDIRGDPNRPVKVWYYRPSGSAPPSGIVFLLHGSTRTGQQAQALGAPFARAERALLLAPEFSQANYPEPNYDFGGIVDSTGRIRPDSLWTLRLIEHLFDAARQATGVVDSTYDIVGHSAGGQFVHRLVLFVAEARIRRAVVSSPGRYAFPVTSVPFPYGLGGSPADTASLRRALQRDVLLVLGDKDVADQTRAWEAQTIAQGRNRFARGLHFFASAAEEAFALGVPLRWRLRIIDNVDHDPPRMVRAALELLRN